MVAVIIIGARSAWLESLSSHWWPTLPRGGVQQHQGVLDHRAAVPSATGGRGSPPEPIQVRAAALLFQRNGKHPFSNTIYLTGDRQRLRPSEFCLSAQRDLLPYLRRRHGSRVPPGVGDAVVKVSGERGLLGLNTPFAAPMPVPLFLHPFLCWASTYFLVLLPDVIPRLAARLLQLCGSACSTSTPMLVHFFSHTMQGRTVFYSLGAQVGVQGVLQQGAHAVRLRPHAH